MATVTVRIIGRHGRPGIGINGKYYSVGELVSLDEAELADEWLVYRECWESVETVEPDIEGGGAAEASVDAVPAKPKRKSTRR